MNKLQRSVVQHFTYRQQYCVVLLKICLKSSSYVNVLNMKLEMSTLTSLSSWVFLQGLPFHFSFRYLTIFMVEVEGSEEHCLGRMYTLMSVNTNFLRSLSHLILRICRDLEVSCILALLYKKDWESEYVYFCTLYWNVKGRKGLTVAFGK